MSFRSQNARERMSAGSLKASCARYQTPWRSYLIDMCVNPMSRHSCRLVSTTFFYGTWVANGTVDGEVYAAFVRACIAAVRRINADKKHYLHYYTREYADYPEVAALTPDDFNLGRIQLKAPEPIPEADARWDWEWMSSWGLLPGSFDAAAQINAAVQRLAHTVS